MTSNDLIQCKDIQFAIKKNMQKPANILFKNV